MSCASTSLPDWQPPTVRLPDDRSHPVVTLPPGGLDLLRRHYRNGGALQEELLGLVKAGEKAVAEEVAYPPRGGHHNMWYQCDDCEAPLTTVSETEHRCRLCGNVYSGEPYDDVVFHRIHGRNLSRLLDAAWAYALTGEETFASFGRDILLGYAERYMGYPYRQAIRQDTEYARRAGGRLFDQTLSEAAYLLQKIAPAYDLIHDSPSIGRDQHRQIREGFILPMMESIARHRRGESNWQSYHNAALFWAGAVLGEVKWMEESVHDPENGFLYQMEHSLSPDGMWYEGSWSYHFYTLGALGEHARGAAHLGMDLWGHPHMKKMLTLPIQYLMGDGSVPRLGNATTLQPQEFAQRRADLMEAPIAATGMPPCSRCSRSASPATPSSTETRRSKTAGD